MTLTWTAAAPLVYGTPLGVAQLDASTTIAGTCAYTPPAGTRLDAGTGQSLSVDVTPADAANYQSVHASVTIDVTPALLTVAAANSSREFGLANPLFAGAVTGVIAGDHITASYSSPADASSPPGLYAIVPHLDDPGGRLFNYTVTSSHGVLTVTDTTGPTLNLPSSITAPATTASGAVVSYAASAADLVDGTVAITCAPASGSTFPIGATTVTCSTIDAHANPVAATFVVTITDPSGPGKMAGEGTITVGIVEHQFDCQVRERSSGAEAGALRYDVRTRMRGRDEEHHFRTTLVRNVFFTDAPGGTPGRRPLSGIDTVSFSGTGLWDGRGGYTFEAVASDKGEPGRGHDVLTLTIRSSAGRVVASVNAPLTDGNIQSTRSR